MITPLDIQNAEFSKSMKGYKQEEVDKFLDSLMLDYENVIKENESLHKELEVLKTRLDEYKAQEGAVIKTLETAKSLMNDISASAEKRADILLRNARLNAEAQKRQASENVERLKTEEEKLQKRVSTIRTRFKSILEAELERIDDLSVDIFGEESGVGQGCPTAEPSKPPDSFESKAKVGFGLGDGYENMKTSNYSGDLFKTKTAVKD